MAKVSVFNIEGSQVGEVELNDAIFGVEVKEHIVHKAVVHQLAEIRQGTQSAKTRAEVRGGGRKPWRQKGTGHARQGSIRAPQWTGGGVVFAPKPRDYSFKMNKKEKRLALKSVLTQKVNDGNLLVVENFDLEDAKTKLLVGVLKNLNAEKAFIVTENDKIYRAGQNIPNVVVGCTYDLNVFEVLKYDKLILDKELISEIEEVYA